MIESIRLAIRTLGANRSRSLLTMLGISIGVGAVIALLSIGTGVQNYISKLFGDAGSNLIAINPGRLQRGGPPGGGGQAFLTGKRLPRGRRQHAQPGVAYRGVSKHRQFHGRGERVAGHCVWCDAIV